MLIIGTSTLTVSAPIYVPIRTYLYDTIVQVYLHANIHTLMHTHLHTNSDVHALIRVFTYRYAVHATQECTPCTCMFALHTYAHTTIACIHSIRKHSWMYASLHTELRFMMTGAIFFESKLTNQLIIDFNKRYFNKLKYIQLCVIDSPDNIIIMCKVWLKISKLHSLN